MQGGTTCQYCDMSSEHKRNIEIDCPPFDELLPGAPFSELHRRVVEAPIDRVWPHCLDVAAAEVRTLGPLIALRGLPAMLRHRRPPQLSGPKPLLEVFVDGGFVILRSDDAPTNGRAAVYFGAAGVFWSITGNTPRHFEGPTDFIEFADPGFAKTVARLEATDQGDGTTLIETETLVAGTDSASTKKFAPYWAVIRLPSGAIRRSWLAAIDRRLSQ